MTDVKLGILESINFLCPAFKNKINVFCLLLSFFAKVAWLVHSIKNLLDVH